MNVCIWSSAQHQANMNTAQLHTMTKGARIVVFAIAMQCLYDSSLGNTAKRGRVIE